MSEKDVVPRRLISSSKSPIVILNALEPVGKLYFSPVSETKMPQICSICEKFALQGACRVMVLTSCSRLATL